MTARIAALHYLETFLGEPYRWGGNDTIGGPDCSGVMVLVLQGAGRLPRTGDWSAEDLRLKFGATAVPIEGCLAFRMSNGKAVHVGMVWSILQDGTVLVIEAAGGDDTIKPREFREQDRPKDPILGKLWDIEKTIEPLRVRQLADDKNAFVKLRPVWAGAVYADPFTSAAGDV